MSTALPDLGRRKCSPPCRCGTCTAPGRGRDEPGADWRTSVANAGRAAEALAWVDLDDFATAWLVALVLHGVKASRADVRAGSHVGRSGMIVAHDRRVPSRTRMLRRPSGHSNTVKLLGRARGSPARGHGAWSDIGLSAGTATARRLRLGLTMCRRARQSRASRHGVWFRASRPSDVGRWAGTATAKWL